MSFSQSFSSLSPTTYSLSKILPPDLCTSWEGANQSSNFMKQKIEEPVLLLLLGKDRAAVPGSRVCVPAAFGVSGKGTHCQVLAVRRVGGKLLV